VAALGGVHAPGVSDTLVDMLSDRDPAIRAGAVVQVEKAGKRVDGQYYVVSTDHLFFVDTGYATELRAKRYTIKKGASPVKDLGKFAKAVQDAAKKAQEIADRIKDAAAWALKAAREAAKRASQALEAAKQVWQDVKAALDQVKKGAGDVADAALKSVEGRLAGLKDYVNSGWFTMLAPRGTPKPIIARLNQELNAALGDPTVRERFKEQGAEPVIFTPEELAKFIASETIKWRDIITKAGIQPIQ